MPFAIQTEIDAACSKQKSISLFQLNMNGFLCLFSSLHENGMQSVQARFTERIAVSFTQSKAKADQRYNGKVRKSERPFHWNSGQKTVKQTLLGPCSVNFLLIFFQRLRLRRRRCCCCSYCFLLLNAAMHLKYCGLIIVEWKKVKKKPVKTNCPEFSCELGSMPLSSNAGIYLKIFKAGGKLLTNIQQQANEIKPRQDKERKSGSKKEVKRKTDEKKEKYTGKKFICQVMYVFAVECYVIRLEFQFLSTETESETTGRGDGRTYTIFTQNRRCCCCFVGAAEGEFRCEVHMNKTNEEHSITHNVYAQVKVWVFKLKNK